jgi:PRTRC genetic system protein C
MPWNASDSETPTRSPDNSNKENEMGSLKAEELVREFHYNGVLIPDPGPELTVDWVRDLPTPNFPEMATASISGPEATGSVLCYAFTLHGAFEALSRLGRLLGPGLHLL